MKAGENLPLVSVVIPCFNAEAFVEAGVSSVLRQGYTNIEIVAVDDGSTDSTAEVLRRLGEPVHVVAHERNRGLAAARNTGFAEAEGELVVQLDADDTLEPGALRALVEAALANPDARLVLPHVDIVDANGALIQSLPPTPYRLDLHQVLALQIPQTPGVLLRKPTESPPMLYDEGFQGRDGRQTASDWVFWIDAAAAGVPVAHAPDAVAHYIQQNPKSLSSNPRVRWQGGLRALEHGKRVALRAHGHCPECSSALVAGRRALAGYCLQADAAVIFGTGVAVSSRLRALSRAARRDPRSIYHLSRASAWRTRDALKGWMRALRGEDDSADMPEPQGTEQPYDAEFFSFHQPLSDTSARVVLPLVFEWLGTRSLIDVGCGLGAWARVAIELGVTDVIGVDGDYVDSGRLEIPASLFMTCNLTSPLELDRRFDLAVCLEVAEHLPETRAAPFINDLCRLSDTVLFSAAIPGQGGTDHKNEQWQSYWAQLFAQAGFDVFDIIRPNIWLDDRVAYWYRQNTFVAARGDNAARLRAVPEVQVMDFLHPGILIGRTTVEEAQASMGLRALFRLLPQTAYRAARRRLPGNSQRLS